MSAPRIACIGHDWDRKELAKLVASMGIDGRAVASLHVESDRKHCALKINGVMIFTFEMHEELGP